jgi:hypothetical protein
MSTNTKPDSTRESKSPTKHRMIFLIIAALLTSSHVLLGQDIEVETIAWNIQQTVDVSTGSSESVSQRIISHGNNHIEWQDEKGILKYDYVIRQVNGKWSNVAHSGSILYEVESGGKQGTIGFTRDGRAIIINLVMLHGDDLPERFRFTISNILPL